MDNLDQIFQQTDDRERRLIEAIISAGDVLLDYWPGSKSEKGLNVQTKNDGSFVTDADFSSNEILLEALQSIYPDDQICSEEVGYVNETGSDRVWFVDPLDGTANFINSEDDFLILVGLCEKARPVKGIAYFPARKIICFAAKDRGAYTNLHGKLQVNDLSTMSSDKINIRDFELSGGPYLSKYHTGAAQYLISIGELQGCAYKVKAEKSPKSWDFVPFEIIITESGGQASDQQGNPILFTAQEFDAQYYVATNGSIHQEFLDLINT